MRAAGMSVGDRPSADVHEELFEEHYEPLVRFARALTDDAELARDLVAEAFVRTYGRIRSPKTAKAYLRRTIVNLARTSWSRRAREWRYRRRWRRRQTDDAPSIDRVDLDRALLNLPMRQRACLVLRYYEDLSERQAAEVLGVTVGTVKSQTHKALRRIRAHVESGDDHDR